MEAGRGRYPPTAYSSAGADILGLSLESNTRPFALSLYTHLCACNQDKGFKTGLSTTPTKPPLGGFSATTDPASSGAAVPCPPPRSL